MLKQIDVDLGLGQPAVFRTLASEPPVAEPDEDEANEQSHVGPRDCEPEDDDSGIGCPAEQTVFLEQAPQRDGKFHAPSLGCGALIIGGRIENVYPLSGGRR